LIEVTAFFLSCLVPTLFVGNVIAAYDVPPSATSSATKASISDGEGRRYPIRFIGPPFIGGRSYERVLRHLYGRLTTAPFAGAAGSLGLVQGSP
jgi:hypothetical protein